MAVIMHIWFHLSNMHMKYKDDIINVYHMNFNGTTGKCTGEWVNAKFVKAQAIQEVRIYFKPDDFNPDESRNVMRVTPDHIFPVIDDNGFIRDKNAYLLQTGDQLILSMHNIWDYLEMNFLIEIKI